MSEVIGPINGPDRLFLLQSDNPGPEFHDHPARVRDFISELEVLSIDPGPVHSRGIGPLRDAPVPQFLGPFLVGPTSCGPTDRYIFPFRLA